MKPMLAGQFVADRIQGQLPVFAQPKLDGIRMFIRDGTAYTRSLKPVRSEWIQATVAEAGPILNGLDGEVIVGSPLASDAYRRTNSSVMSYQKPDEARFHVFDHWGHEGNFRERIEYLRNLSLPSFCELVETVEMSSMEEILRYESHLLSLGHEGVILRKAVGFYKYGRASPTGGELIKMKKFTDTEVIVTGFKELMHNDNAQTTNALGYAERSSHREGLIGMGTLGALLCEGKFPDGRAYEVSVGSGFDQALRQKIWDDQIEYLGKIVKIKYFELGIKEKPRFPIFLGFRDRTDMDPQPKGGAEPARISDDMPRDLFDLL